jgi:thiol-activated cytolysin
MKNKIKNIIYLSLVASTTMITSCTKEDTLSGQKSISELQPVKYDFVADKIASSTKTGNIVFNSVKSVNEFEYLTVVEKQVPIYPLSLVSTQNLDVIYPGSILRGSSFLNGVYDPLVLKNKFNKVNLSVSLRGRTAKIVSETFPILSDIRTAINAQLENYDPKSVPSVFEYESTEIINSKSFAASMDFHASANIIGLVTASLNFNVNGNTSETSRYVMVKMRQMLYNFAIDPKYYSDWIDGEIDPKQCGTHEPVYINSVDYGRIAYILIQSNETKEHIESFLQTAAKGGISGVFDGSNETTYRASFDAWMRDSRVKFIVMGGPVSLGQQIVDFDTFKKFVQAPTTSDLVDSAIPISYKVRRLKDNTEIEVKDISVTRFRELKAE